MSGVYKTEAWLNKYGWTKGKGLGKNENGIKDFIKLDKKDDTVGLGGEGYAIRDFNWWDSIYTKAAQKLKIESTADGKSVVHVEQPKVEVAQEKKYGVFVKSKEPDNFSSNIREEELIKVCEGRQLKASMTGKLARLEEQEKQVISSNTLRISKKRGQEDNNDSTHSSNIKQHKEGKKTPYGSNYKPLVLPEKIVKTGDKVQQQSENTKSVDNNTEDKESKKSKKNKKRKRSEIESKEDQSSNSKSNAQNTKKTKTKQHNDNNKTTETNAAGNTGFFFFNYDNENKKLEDSQKHSTPKPASIEELYSDGTERKSKSAKRKAKKQRTK
jgi:hypothetical protein